MYLVGAAATGEVALQGKPVQPVRGLGHVVPRPDVELAHEQLDLRLAARQALLVRVELHSSACAWLPHNSTSCIARAHKQTTPMCLVAMNGHVHAQLEHSSRSTLAHLMAVDAAAGNAAHAASHAGLGHTLPIDCRLATGALCERDVRREGGLVQHVAAQRADTARVRLLRLTQQLPTAASANHVTRADGTARVGYEAALTRSQWRRPAPSPPHPCSCRTTPWLPALRSW